MPEQQRSEHNRCERSETRAEQTQTFSKAKAAGSKRVMPGGGRSTERLSRDELKQLLLAFGGDGVAAQTERELPVPAPEQPEQVSDEKAVDAQDQEASPSESTTPKKKSHRVRAMKVAASVERHVTTVLVPQDERQCCNCNQEMKPFG
jgi:hypothetical protein